MCVCIFHFRSFFEQFYSFLVILIYAIAVPVTLAEVAQSQGVVLVSCELEPFDGFFVILGDALAVVIAIAKVHLRV